MSGRGGRALDHREVSLVDVLDRVLGAGVVITGDITLSLAEIDLVYLSLRVLVGSQPLFADPEAVPTGDVLLLDEGPGGGA